MQNRKIVVPLANENRSEMQQLKKAIKDNNSKRMHIRYMVIFNHLDGYTNKAISKHGINAYLAIKGALAGRSESLIFA